MVIVATALNVYAPDHRYLSLSFFLFGTENSQGGKRVFRDA